MRAVVTGAAGFVGSNLCDALLARDWSVIGIDRFSDYYAEPIKRANLADAIANPSFELREVDLCAAGLEHVVDDVDVIFHQAAQAGVRASWGSDFATYQHDNIAATQILLEAVANSVRRPRVVYASSSSVYGNAEHYPTTEADLPKPHSPYGVTKLAAEHLCRLYGSNLGVHTVSLRYFTVYGPRQRPDMAFHRLSEAVLGGPAFPLFGDGSQIRDFTFVSDIVAANIAAAAADVEPGSCFNIAGGGHTSMREAIDLVGSLAGSEVPILAKDAQIGDVHRTGGSTELAQSMLGWQPVVGLEEGLRQQLAHHRLARCAHEEPMGSSEVA